MQFVLLLAIRYAPTNTHTPDSRHRAYEWKFMGKHAPHSIRSEHDMKWKCNSISIHKLEEYAFLLHTLSSDFVVPFVTGRVNFPVGWPNDAISAERRNDGFHTMETTVSIYFLIFCLFLIFLFELVGFQHVFVSLSLPKL